LSFATRVCDIQIGQISCNHLSSWWAISLLPSEKKCTSIKYQNSSDWYQSKSGRFSFKKNKLVLPSFCLCSYIYLKVPKIRIWTKSNSLLKEKNKWYNIILVYWSINMFGIFIHNCIPLHKSIEKNASFSQILII